MHHWGHCRDDSVVVAGFQPKPQDVAIEYNFLGYGCGLKTTIKPLRSLPVIIITNVQASSSVIKDVPAPSQVLIAGKTTLNNSGFGPE